MQKKDKAIAYTYGGVVMVNQDRIVQELLELVQIDSAPGRERQLADALKQKLTALGLEVFEMMPVPL